MAYSYVIERKSIGFRLSAVLTAFGINGFVALYKISAPIPLTTAPTKNKLIEFNLM